jgi:multicomponent Na+:H+ antiporter subunit C
VTPTVFYGLIAAAVFCLALDSLLASRHLLRRLIAANVMGSAVFLLMVTLARRGSEVDPIPHAMVLTGIVVAVAATGLGVVLLRRIFAETGRAHLPEDDQEEG